MNTLYRIRKRFTKERRDRIKGTGASPVVDEIRYNKVEYYVAFRVVAAQMRIPR